MKYIRISALLVSFLMMLALQAQTSLKYNLEEGTVFKVKQHAKQFITQQMEGTKHEMTNDLNGLYDFKVVGADENGYDLILIFQDFALKSNSSIQGVLMDVKATELVEGDIMSEMFRIEDDFTTNLMRKSLAKEFSSDGLAKSFEQMTFFYPDVEVATDDTWQNTYTGKLSSNNTFKLEKIADNITSISGTAAIVMNTEESGAVMSLSGSQETAIQANTSTGFIKKIMISSLAEGNTKMAQMGNLEIPTTIKSTITYELLVGNGIFLILLSLIFIFLYFRNEIILLAFLRMRKQDMEGTQKWLTRIKNPEAALTIKQQGYYNYLHGIIFSQKNLTTAEKYFKKALKLGLTMDR